MLLSANKTSVDELLADNGTTQITHKTGDTDAQKALADRKKINFDTSGAIAKYLNDATYKGVPYILRDGRDIIWEDKTTLHSQIHGDRSSCYLNFVIEPFIQITNLKKLTSHSCKLISSGFVALGIFSLLLLSSLIVGIFTTAFLDPGDLELYYKIRNLGISLSVTSTFAILAGVLIANYNERYHLKDVNIKLKTNRPAESATNLTKTDIEGLKWADDPSQHEFNKAVHIIRSNIVAAFGVCCIALSFFIVLIFSILLFLKYNESLAAPLFLFTFIASVSALTFGGIAISSAIAVFVLKGKQAATDEARICSLVLFMSFILIASTSISLEDFNIVQTIGGFLIFEFLAAIVSATTADSGIKKLFDIYIPQKGKEEDAEEMKKREAKKGNGHDWFLIAMLASSIGYHIYIVSFTSKNLQYWILIIILKITSGK